MRKSLAIRGMLATAAAALTLPAAAITGTNWVEDNEHPFVGLIVFYDAAGEFVQRCSGSLISPTKFLTAGHCTDANAGVVSARVYFQQNAGANYDPATQVDPPSAVVGPSHVSRRVCRRACWHHDTVLARDRDIARRTPVCQVGRWKRPAAA